MDVECINARLVIFRVVDILGAMTRDWEKLTYDMQGHMNSCTMVDVLDANRMFSDAASEPPLIFEWGWIFPWLKFGDRKRALYVGG